MKKTLKILRRRSPEDKPYFESFVYEAEDEGATVATALMEISSRTDLMWEHSCLQKKCGACAMVINGRPVLACDTRLSAVKGPEKNTTPGQIREAERNDETAFEASRCIQCGLCLEVCPNYYREGNFSGMAAMAPLARLLAKDEDPRIRETYRKSVYEGCGKSLACRDVCPAGIDMDRLLSRSNGKAVFRWKR